jgi:hypothetical protein
LCESLRTASGPRQHVVATLGKLDARDLTSVGDDHAGWEDFAASLGGRARRKKMRQPELGESPASAASTPAAQWELVNVAALRVERTR